MRGSKPKLKESQRKELVDLYASDLPRGEIQKRLAKKFKVTTRTIRTEANRLGLMNRAIPNDKILVYDIETSRVQVDVWSTGKQYVRHDQLRTEPKIISIAWKWIGQDKVYSLTWDKNHCDKAMLEEFLKEYNTASLIVGQNNNTFDNKWITTRAAKHRLFVDRYVKSFDIMRQARRYLRLPSYSMAYMAKYFGLTLKQSHEGLHMWDMIEYGNKQEQKEYLKKMVDYNKGDIVTTEELYITLQPYFGSVTNKAVQAGLPKWACPVSGSKDVVRIKSVFTEMGTIQRIMYCESSDTQYKISNRSYMHYLQRGLTNDAL